MQRVQTSAVRLSADYSSGAGMIMQSVRGLTPAKLGLPMMFALLPVMTNVVQVQARWYR